MKLIVFYLFSITNISVFALPYPLFKKEQLKTVVSQYKNKQLSILDLEVHPFLQDTLSVVPLNIKSNISLWETQIDIIPRNLENTVKRYWQKNYFVTDIEGYERDGLLYFAGTWMYSRVNLNTELVVNLFNGEANLKSKTLRQKNKILTDIETYVYGARRRYAFVAQDNRDKIPWHVDWEVPRDIFKLKVNSALAKDYQLEDIEVYFMRGQIYYSLLWYKMKKNKQRQFVTDLSLSQFEIVQANMQSKGFQIYDIEIYQTESGESVACIWEKKLLP